MITIQLKDLHCPETVLVPRRESAFQQVVKTVANPSQVRILVVNIDKSLASIRHKLTVVMYQSALICELRPDDFASFVEASEHSRTLAQGVSISYKGCSFEMNELSEYQLFLTLFIETFSVTALSLFDVCGYLLNDLYDLRLSSDETSFYKAYQRLDQRGSSNSAKILELLSRYNLENVHCVDWFGPLKEVRNRTTHRPITDVCDLASKRSIYTAVSVSKSKFVLSKEVSPCDLDVELCDFAKQVFEGLQEFVETFYDYLSDIVQGNASLPV